MKSDSLTEPRAASCRCPSQAPPCQYPSSPCPCRYPSRWWSQWWWWSLRSRCSLPRPSFRSPRERASRPASRTTSGKRATSSSGVSLLSCSGLKMIGRLRWSSLRLPDFAHLNQVYDSHDSIGCVCDSFSLQLDLLSLDPPLKSHDAGIGGHVHVEGVEIAVSRQFRFDRCRDGGVVDGSGGR